ncbi:MAG: DUF4019 domain-containing protein [Pyrinomonadaceae bacterium]
MADERSSVKMLNPGAASYFQLIPVRTICFVQILFVLVISLSGVACGFKGERRSIPPEIETVIATVTEDIAAERYEKIYNEASDLWRQDLTLEQSISAFKTLNAKLGKIENRVLHSATEQHNSGGPLEGEAFIITYQTKFERGEGMETFTLVKRGQRWLLARYFVNSTALK